MSTTTTNLGLTLPAGSDPADIAVLNTNFGLIDTFAGQQTAKDTAQDARMAAIENDATDRDARLTALEQSDTAQAARLTALEQADTAHAGRLTALEASDTAQDGRLTALEQADTAHAGRLTALETSDAAQDSRLILLETSDAAQDGRLTDLETADTAQAARLTALETSDTAQDSRLTALETSDTAQDGRLTDLETADQAQDAALASAIDAGAKNIANTAEVVLQQSAPELTFSLTDDVYSIVGTTSSATNRFLNIYYKSPSTAIIPPGDYVARVYPPHAAARLACAVGGSVTARGDYGGALAFTIPEGAASNWLRLEMKPSTPFDYQFRLLICKAEDYAASDAFVPYTPTLRALYEMILALA